MNSKYRFVIILLGISVILLGIGIYFSNNNEDEQITFSLYGEERVSMYEGDIYFEEGFIALDKDNNRLNQYVVIETNLDSDTVGTYTITYKLMNKTLTRTVEVITNPLKHVDFSLLGNRVVNLNLNDVYNDPLFTCLDKDKAQDLSNSVRIESNLNVQAVGTYEIKYTLTVGDKQKTLTRTVHVLEKKYLITLSTEQLTNQDVTINLTSNITNFSYMITPDNQTVYDNYAYYTVPSNNTYKFIVYDNENSYEEILISVNNIDKIAPVLSSCTAYIENNKTNYSVTTNDTDIAKFVISSNQSLTSTSKTFTFNSVIETANVIAVDNANNQTSISCNAYYKQVLPSGGENIIFNEESETMKLWIERIDRVGRIGYHVSHIWVKDAYNQFKANVPDNFGGELLVAKDLLTNAVNRNNLGNKMAVAVNASGFVLSGTWGTNFYRANKLWNRTSGSPIVIVEGRVLRDFASTIPSASYITYGLKRDGYLQYYRYTEGTNLQSNINVSNQIISDGVANTFAFDPVLVENGQVVAPVNERNVRQGFCQIDKNNFVFITDRGGTRNGFTYLELAQYMSSIGCKIGFNLDGGGSTSLIVKSRNGQPTTISGNSRQIADIIYFHE